jgi:hypothetical protein
MRKKLFKKSHIFAITFLLIFMPLSTGSVFKSNNIEVVQVEYFESNEVFNGSLSGFVTDPLMNPIEGALIRVHFHETYEEDYSDENGYYHVTNIPICYCMKNATCSKEDYKTEWVLLGITENTTYDFVLYPLEPYPVFNGTMCGGWWNSPVTVSFVFDPEEVAEIWYGYKGWHRYTEPFVVNENGSICIDYYWINYEGEQSPPATFCLDIDQIPHQTYLTWEVYKIGFRWYVKFILTASDELSGMSPCLEIYINDMLLGIFEVWTWPTVFDIQWFKTLKYVKFGFRCYDMAGNFAYEYVNGSDIKSCSLSKNILTLQSINILFQKFLEQFPIIRVIYSRL